MVKSKATYRVLVGCNFPGKLGKEVRAEIGTTLRAEDVEPKVLESLLAQHSVEEVADAGAAVLEG